MSFPANHLVNQTSPYLLQHAHNPVDWYPWGEEALQKAKQENKPILLSIGYAACHWCHVMAHESFSDEEIATLMNQWFINIKVDREERPDLDKIYQTSHQLLTGQSGGWPLTIFLTPDTQVPFYSGTYFPAIEGFGRPSFKNLLIEIAHFYHQRRDTIEKMTKTLIEALDQIAHTPAGEQVLNDEPLKHARDELEKTFDFIHGGFGHAPKFPLPTHLETLLQNWYYQNGQDKDAINMVHHSLTHMARGGFNDQLGGGFFRYCVDANWRIPHFEKMLYDNAQLIPIYVNASIINADKRLQEWAIDTLQWVLRELRAPEGGFYASLNADSEGIEGKFYYWDRQDVRNALSELEYSAAEVYYGLNQPPNFEGHWHLYLAEGDDSDLAEYNQRACQKLFAAREKRIHPSCDTKILTSWNALMIKALACAGLALGRQDFVDAGQQALDFIIDHLWKNQRLLSVYSQGKANFSGYLDDYAFLLDAVLNFLQVRWHDRYLQFAIRLADQLCEYFYDKTGGGFFFTAEDHEILIQRPKLFADEALPAGNGIAVLGLLRLGNLLSNKNYLNIAEKSLQAAWPQIIKRPSYYDSLLSALRAYLHPPTVIILRGEESLMAQWQREFASHYLPDFLCYSIPASADLPLALQKPIPEVGVNAYICQGQTCREVIQNQQDFINYLISS